MKRICMSALMFLTTLCASGADVIWGAVSFEYVGGNQFWFTVTVPSPYPEHPDELFTVRMFGDYDSNLARTVLTPLPEVVLAPLQAWRVFDEGDEISPSTLIGDDLEYFFNSAYPHAWEGKSDYLLMLKRGQSNAPILGFIIYDDILIGNEYHDVPATFGWVELGYDGSQVYVVDSAMDASGRGIYAGTGAVVPEPACAWLAFSGCALLLRRSRHGRRL